MLPSHSTAFIIYSPKDRTGKDFIFYNEEAWKILSLSICPPVKKGNVTFADISSLCSIWKRLMDKKPESPPVSSEDKNNRSDWIATLRSHRRQYAVRGMALTDNHTHYTTSNSYRKQYLFVLERICPDHAALLLAFRQRNLSQRECEIVQLLLDDRCNKEIARRLCLSINTVKDYLKQLMKKLNVTTRAGIIAAIFTEKPKTER